MARALRPLAAGKGLAAVRRGYTQPVPSFSAWSLDSAVGLRRRLCFATLASRAVSYLARGCSLHVCAVLVIPSIQNPVKRYIVGYIPQR